jgi:hypothetical protein
MKSNSHSTENSRSSQYFYIAFRCFLAGRFDQPRSIIVSSIKFRCIEQFFLNYPRGTEVQKKIVKILENLPFNLLLAGIKGKGRVWKFMHFL